MQKNQLQEYCDQIEQAQLELEYINQLQDEVELNVS